MKEKSSVKISFGSRLLYYFLAVVLWIAAKLVLGFRLDIEDEVKKWKKSKNSFVIFSAHPSVVDAIVLQFACFPRYARFVVAAQQLYSGFRGWGLRALHVIPKKQFTPDIRAIMEMIRTVKSGLILGMMPEGRVSLDTTQNPIDPSTAKLIKKLGVPVAVLIPHGTYFVKPPYLAKGIVRGKISGELKALFNEEDVKTLTSDEIMEKLSLAISYNESESLRGTGHKYGSKSKPYMRNVTNLFYRCPSCGAMYTIGSDGRKISCSECGMSIDISREMFFISENKELPDNIAAWNKTQLDYEHGYWSAPGASFSSRVSKTVMHIGSEDSFTEAGEGILTLDSEGMHYKDDEETLDIPLHAIPGVSGEYEKRFVTFYQEDIIRRFYLEDVRMVARFINSLMVLKGLK